MIPIHATGYGSLANWEQTSAVSDAAAHLQELIGNLFRSTDGVRALSGRETSFENELRLALDELVVDEDQEAVSTAAVQLALRLVRSLPSDIPVPEVAIDPDGDISLDWVPSRTRAFSISIGDSDRVAYASMDGSDQSHGVVRFMGALPNSLLMQLAELTKYAAASVRIA